MTGDADDASARSASESGLATLLAALGRGYGVGKTLVATLASFGRRVAASLRNAAGWLGERLRGPTARTAVDTLRTGLVGRRLDVTAAAVLSAPLLALLANWWAAGVGYRTVEQWVVGTWYGTDPRLAVFVGVGLLVALAAVSAAVNSGLAPTTLLVVAPLFGVAFTRYGLTLEYYGTVGVPGAVGIGLALAVLFGAPIAVVGFTLGTVLRRVGRALRGRNGEDPLAERA